MSIIDPLTCGFAKIAAFNILQDQCGIRNENNESKKIFKTRLLKLQHQKYLQYFDESKENYNVEYKIFIENFPSIVIQIRHLNKRYSDTKEELLDTFSKSNWDDLGVNKKSKHSFVDCKGCFKDKELKKCLAKFPIKKGKNKNKALQAGLYKEQILSDVTNSVVQRLDTEFKQIYKTTFTKAVKEHVKDFESKKTDIKSIAKDIVTDCEQQYAESSVVR